MNKWGLYALLLCCILVVEPFNMGRSLRRATPLCYDSAASFSDTHVASSKTDTDLDELTKAFLDRYNSSQLTSPTSVTSVLFSDIRSHRTDVDRIGRKKYSISFGDDVDLGDSKQKYFKSGPSKLINGENKTIEVVNQFRFVIDEKQIRNAMEKRSDFVEAKNVGAGIDRGLEQKMDISTDMIKLLKSNAQRVKNDDGKLVYRLNMDYNDFLKYTSSKNDEGNDVDPHDERKDQLLIHGRNSDSVERTKEVKSEPSDVHNQKTKLRSRVIEQAGNERFEDKYSDLVEQEEKLNHKKPVMRQKELTSRNLAIPASQSTPHFKLHHKRSFNYENSNTIYLRASTSTYISDTHDMKMRKEAVEKAYFTDQHKKSGIKRWGRNIMFKWRKMDKDVEVVYSALLWMYQALLG